MSTLQDWVRTRYRKRNKNVFVSKKVDRYLQNLSSQTLAEPLIRDYKRITNLRDGSYQTPLNQLEFMGQLLRAADTKTVLEIGTFQGFTCLYLAQALGEQAEITTCEIDGQRLAEARKLWEAHSVDAQVTAIEGDALTIMQSLKGTFDAIYIDGDKKQYPACYKEAQRLCNVGGLILLDNMLWAGLVPEANTKYSHAQLLNKLNNRIYSEHAGKVSLVPAWDGLLIVEV